MMLSFRPAVLADGPAITTLVNSAYRGESSRAGWTTEEHLLDGQRTDAEAIAEIIASPDQWIWLAFDQGRLIGSMQLAREKDKIYLGMLTVSPPLQGQGVGRALLEKAEEIARNQLGAKAVRMTVISVRDELIAYYERRGYRRTGETKPFPMDDTRFGLPKRRDFHLVVLEKTLPRLE